MNAQVLFRILELSKKTGDRCLIVPENGEQAFAVLPIGEYEKLILGSHKISDLTEDELLDRINRDIALWKGHQDQDQIDTEEMVLDNGLDRYEIQAEDESEIEEDTYYFERV